MYHQLNASFFCRTFRHSRHFHAHYFQGRRNHSGFNTTYYAFTFFYGLNSFIQIDTCRAKDVWSGCKPCTTNVQKGYDFGIVIWNDVLREPSIRITPRASGVYHGGNTSMHSPNICLDTVPINPRINVCV